MRTLALVLVLCLVSGSYAIFCWPRYFKVQISEIDVMEYRSYFNRNPPNYAYISNALCRIKKIYLDLFCTEWYMVPSKYACYSYAGPPVMTEFYGDYDHTFVYTDSEDL